MKSLFLGLIVSLSASVSAATFTTQEEFNVHNGSYSLPQAINIQVLNVNPNKDIAEIKVDGIVKTYSVNFVRSEVEAYENIFTYSANLGSNILANGSSCEDYEEISFDLELTVEDEPRDPHTFATFSAVSLKAIHSYNWDICHGQTETKVINYKK